MDLPFQQPSCISVADTSMPMDGNLVHELLERIPLEWLTSPMPANTPAALCLQSAAKRRAQLRYNPAFGWKFVALHVQHHAHLPWSAMEEPLLHVEEFVRNGKPSRELEQVIALAGHPTLAPALRALLIARDADIGQAAEWLGVPEFVVQWFAVLLWNVYYRRDEHGFVQAIVFPHSRLTDLDAEQPRAWEAALLQLAWRDGTAAVQVALGGNVGGDQPAAGLGDLEEQLLLEATAQIRLGGLKRKTTPALREALLLVRAQKIHDLRQPPPPEFGLGGLEDLSRRYFVSDEIMAHAKRANPSAPDDPRDEEIRAKLRSVRRTPAGEKTHSTPGGEH
ncbi:MAG: hypothetical protein FD161_1241 [Limisphaerales bacterium]|nr:MAG: hypothetical protein FD161_1241 [Limisphaerales bacterium]TXT49513.1 MAG: hypothetical protein FD140_3045 [Limisphaerales bacterium]